jgi:O-antigen/teichoic acid export membrane protein
MITTVVLPIGMGVFIFANEILYFWTRNRDIADNAGSVLQFLILGNMINSLMTIPFQYTLSLGWTKFGINISLAALIFFFPFTFWAATQYGIRGGAFMWMALNTAFLIFAMAYLFSKVLQTERRAWYLHDVIKPVLISMLVAVPFYFIHQYVELSTLAAVALCGVCIVTCFFATVMVGAPALKPEIKSFIQKIRFRKS